jgi:Holliday junction DNA helicase RuvA
VEGFVRCVQSRDAAALTKVPGVGRKTAERLIVDLRDRVEEMVTAGVGAAALLTGSGDAATTEGEVFGALVALGYKPGEARRLLEQARPGHSSAPDLLRAALKLAAPPGRN